MADDGDGATDPDDASSRDDSGVDDGADDDVDDYGRAAEILGFSRWWQIVAAAGMMAAVSPYQYVWSSIEQPLAESLDLALPALGAVFSFTSSSSRSRSSPPGSGATAAVGRAHVPRRPARRRRVRRTRVRDDALAAVPAVLARRDRRGDRVHGRGQHRGQVVPGPDGTHHRRRNDGVRGRERARGPPYVRANRRRRGGDVLRNVGVAILVVTLVGAYLLRDPPDDWLGLEEDGDGAEGGDRSDNLAASLRGRAYTTREMLSTWQFWLLYAMFVAMAGADLIVIANVVRFAEQFGWRRSSRPRRRPLLPVAAGVSRMILGEASDRFDRKKVMAASFVLAGVFRLALIGAGRAEAGVAFVALVMAAMFFSSPLFVYFPSVIADYYGSQNSSGNYAVLYTAKVGGGVFAGTVTGYLVATAGWIPTFALGGGLAIAAGLAALLLRPPSGSGLEADATAAAD